MKTRCALVVSLCVSAVTWAQSNKVSVAATPLDLEPNPALLKYEKELQTQWFKLLDEKSGAIVPSRKVMEAAVKETKRTDFHESDEALSKLAEKSGTLYAVFATLQYSVKKHLVLIGRVVRDDGKLMKTARVELPKGEDTIVGMLGPLSVQFFNELRLKELPTFKEMKKDPDPVVVKKDPDPVVVKDPPPPPPPLVVKETNPLRVVGLIGAGTGAAVGVAGIVVFATAPTVEKDPDGNIKNPDVFKQAYGQQSVGVGLMIGGFAVAAASGVLAALATDTETIKTTVVPMPGGAAVLVGGSF